MKPNEIYEKLSDEELIALYKGKQILNNVHRKKVIKAIVLLLLAFMFISVIFVCVRRLSSSNLDNM